MWSRGNKGPGTDRIRPVAALLLAALSWLLLNSSPAIAEAYAAGVLTAGVLSRYSSAVVPNQSFGTTAVLGGRIAKGIRGIGDVGISVASATYQADFGGGAGSSSMPPNYRYRVRFVPVLLDGVLELGRRGAPAIVAPIVVVGVGLARTTADLRAVYDLAPSASDSVVSESARGWRTTGTIGLGLRWRPNARFIVSSQVAYVGSSSLSDQEFQSLPIREVRGIRAGSASLSVGIRL